MLTAMREAGFNQVFIGIETPDPKGLEEAGKTLNLKTDMEKSIRDNPTTRDGSDGRVYHRV